MDDVGMELDVVCVGSKPSGVVGDVTYIEAKGKVHDVKCMDTRILMR